MDLEDLCSDLVQNLSHSTIVLSHSPIVFVFDKLHS